METIMYSAILVGHGGFAAGLKGSLEMIAGEQENLISFDFLEGQNYETYEKDVCKVAKELSEKHKGVLILADIVGGSPFRVAMLATHEIENAKVIAGANSPMLLQWVANMDSDESLDEMVDLLLSAGKDNIQAHSLGQENDKTEENDDLGDGI
jgi:PTS system N-acetylgalactosamine-specific IIA component